MIVLQESQPLCGVREGILRKANWMWFYRFRAKISQVEFEFWHG
jgi:hypothetical protein